MKMAVGTRVSLKENEKLYPNRRENLLSMRENCSGFSGRRRYACFHLVDLKNINNMKPSKDNFAAAV
jgi:hypothetical protein